jgi:hypothetical protein
MMTSTFDIVSSIGIIISSLGVIAAFLVGARQISLARKAISAQSFLNLHQLEIASRGDGEDGIAVIAALAKNTNYTEFAKDVSDERKRDAIYRAVAFLNFVAILGEEGYLEVQDGWDIYFMAYRTSYEKLWHESTAWWLKHQRESQPNVFPSFERACSVTHAISSDMTDAWRKRMLPQYVKRYKPASRLTKKDLKKILEELELAKSQSPSKVGAKEIIKQQT